MGLSGQRQGVGRTVLSLEVLRRDVSPRLAQSRGWLLPGLLALFLQRPRASASRCQLSSPPCLLPSSAFKDLCDSIRPLPMARITFDVKVN